MSSPAASPAQYHDVVVIGGGNAALCAALSARRAGASVLVIELASQFYRGGNTRHTRNMRCAHDIATDTLTGPYSEDEFWDDFNRVTAGETNEELARHMIHESKEILTWIGEQGVRFQPSLGGTPEPWPHQFILSRRRSGNAQCSLHDCAEDWRRRMAFTRIRFALMVGGRRHAIGGTYYEPTVMIK